MHVDQQHILFVEDDRMLAMFYSDVLEDVGFKTGPAFDYELDNIVAHFAYSREDARRLIRNYPFEIVLLDHNLGDGQTSDGLVSEIFRRSPECQLFLCGSSPDVQFNAVTDALNAAGLARHVPHLKRHAKNDLRGLVKILNAIIRPSGFSPEHAQHPRCDC